MALLNYIRLSLLVLTFISGAAASHATAADIGEEAVRQTMTAYFQALKSGDVQTLVDLLADPLLANRRLLLENNSAYPDHLREYYENADFVIHTIASPRTDIYTVNAEISFGRDANSGQSRFFLKSEGGQLKIFNEITDE